MMRYAYRYASGVFSDLRFVAQGYALKADEREGQGDELPAIEELPDYAPPPLTPEQVYSQALRDDVDRQDLLARLRGATPEQIKNYINTNVTDLASAKVLLTKIVLAIALVVR